MIGVSQQMKLLPSVVLPLFFESPLGTLQCNFSPGLTSEEKIVSPIKEKKDLKMFRLANETLRPEMNPLNVLQRRKAIE